MTQCSHTELYTGEVSISAGFAALELYQLNNQVKQKSANSIVTSVCDGRRKYAIHPPSLHCGKQVIKRDDIAARNVLQDQLLRSYDERSECSGVAVIWVA